MTEAGDDGQGTTEAGDDGQGTTGAGCVDMSADTALERICDIDRKVGNLKNLGKQFPSCTRHTT